MKVLVVSLALLFLFNACSASTGFNTDQCVKNGIGLKHRKAVTSSLSSSRTILEYFMTVDINGTRVEVVADTGSSNLVLKKEDYSPAFGATTAAYTLSYGDGNNLTTVNEYRGNVGLPCGPSVSSYYFGVMDRITPPGYHLPSVLGLAYVGAAQQGAVYQRTFFKQLTETGLSEEFAMLLCGFENPKSELTFGSYDTSLNPQFMYVPIIQKTWYVINASSIGVNGQQYPLAGTTIVDSGTTRTHLPQAIVTNIVNQVAGKGNLPAASNAFYTTPGFEINCSGVDYSKLPTVTVALDKNFNLEMPPQKYLKNTGGTNCIFGFAPADSLNILGQVTMENYYVHFDRKNSQIGFAPNRGMCGN